jgi:ATP-dependent Clp endopeptidase proteolytic subunit ClpP
MFRLPIDGNPEQTIQNDHLEFSSSFLTRKRRILCLRGVVLGWPSVSQESGRTDAYGPTFVFDDILALNELSDEPITLLIHSPGGDVDEGMMLYDIVRMSRAPIHTVGLICASMATVLLAAGARRFCLPHSRFLLHNLRGGAQGDPTEQMKHAKEMERMADSLLDCYLECGVTADVPYTKKGKKPAARKIRSAMTKDIERFRWLDAKGAVEYGLVDEIIPQEMLFPCQKS